jgi:hypothetical protein
LFQVQLVYAARKISGIDPSMLNNDFPYDDKPSKNEDLGATAEGMIDEEVGDYNVNVEDAIVATDDDLYLGTGW